MKQNGTFCVKIPVSYVLSSISFRKTPDNRTLYILRKDKEKVIE